MRLIETISNSFSFPWGVPQGSLMGPFQYNILHVLGYTIKAHHIHHLMYADDTQLYVLLNSHKTSIIPKLN